MKNKKKPRDPKQKRSRERVQLILDATSGVLESDGVRALSTNSIAARAGIPVSSIYQYFPNKQAILVALYDDYLQNIRAVYEEADSPENHALPWKDFFSMVIPILWAAESRGNIDAEFETALGLYPELVEVDRLHEEWIAGRFAESFKRLGTKWPRAKLMRLGYFLYESNSTLWTYRSRHKPPKKEAQDWALTSLLALIEKCFE